MKQQILISALILLSIAGFAGAANLPGLGFYDLWENDFAAYKQGELIVRFAEVEAGTQPAEGPVIIGPWRPQAIRSAISAFILTGAVVDREYDGIVSGMVLVKLPWGVSVLDAVIRFNESPNVLYAEPNYKYKLSVIPNDPRFDEQWGMDNTGQTYGLPDADIDAPEAWDIFTGDPNIIVAVTDTGIDVNHPDLIDNIWINPGEVNDPSTWDPNDFNDVDDDGNGYVDDVFGWDFAGDVNEVPTDGDNDPCDFMYHGTHVAGIIGAVGDNDEGVAGVCWNVKIMALKIFADDDGVDPVTFVSDAVAAIEYATDMGADVINASWGGGAYSQALYDSIAASGDAGILFVAAAGNEGASFAIYPAAYDLDNIISVMSTDHFDNMSRFSNYGLTSVDLGAPGTNILSTFPTYQTLAMAAGGYFTDYDTISGTSMAAPHVAGACALVKGFAPGFTHLQIKQMIMRGVDRTLPGLCASEGRLNLYVSVNMAEPGVVLNANTLIRYPTIQEAIDEAVDGDEIIADANYWYFETIDFLGKEITVRSGDVNDPPLYGLLSPAGTYISGLFDDTTGPEVNFSSGEDANTALLGFTITDGDEGIYLEDSSPRIGECIVIRNAVNGIYCVSSSPAISDCTITGHTADSGSGIYCNDDSDPNISNCIISDNTALSNGGGIYCNNDSDPNISNCTISDNTAFWNGGGIYCSNRSDPNISNCIVTGNTAEEGPGGGIYCDHGSEPNIFNSTIAQNAATWEGGGIYSINGSPEISDCIITGNTSAWSGGGIFYDNGSEPNITNCMISNNFADYDGGGIYCYRTSPLIKNCLIIDNKVDSWDGGGIFCSDASPTLINSTIAGNSANDFDGMGGAVYCAGASAPIITDCIFSNNVDTAIYEGDAESDPNVTFCLFHNNINGDYYDRDSDSFYDVNSVEPDNVLANRNNLGTDPMFVPGRLGNYYLSQYEAGQVLDRNGQIVDPNVNPEDATSPAVDAGSAEANLLEMHRRSTRTDNYEDPNGNKDLGRVDIGYHYDDQLPVVQYTLITSVVPMGTGTISPGPGWIRPDPANNPHTYAQYSQVPLAAGPDDPDVHQFKYWNGTDDDTRIDMDTTRTGGIAAFQSNIVTMDSNKTVAVAFETIFVTLRTRVIGGEGTVKPRNGAYLRGDVVPLTATPANPSHYIKWNGTDYDFSYQRTNTVTMSTPFMIDPRGREYKEVEVTFYAPRTLDVPGDYTNIQLAIDDAYNGDIILIAPGTYDIYESTQDKGTRLVIVGKAITITGVNPDDPCTVAETVIEGGFLIVNADRDTVINGLTIEAHYASASGANGQGSGVDGAPGMPIAGAGMRLHSYFDFDGITSSSPDVRNCVFRNCTITAGHGGNGASGGDAMGWGGNGGWGGRAHGGAVSIGVNARPIFTNCTFLDCWAQGGDGGNGGDWSGGIGGHGGSWGEPDLFLAPWLWEYWTFYALFMGPLEDYWKYSGYGGAVYCDVNSSPEFVDCMFEDSQAYGGSCGLSGSPMMAGWPSEHYRIDRFGGAVYFAADSSPVFTGCTFIDNEADVNGPATHHEGSDPENQTVLDDLYISYGGAIALEDGANPSFENCTFNDNLANIGGAMWSTWSGPNIADCNFAANTAYHGGGVYFVGGTAEIARSNFSENEALADVRITMEPNDANFAPEVLGEGGAIHCFDANSTIVDCDVFNNDAAGSGGGLYISGSGTSLVKNCLITQNFAGRDGAGVSANWHSDCNIVDCTIANNRVGGGGYGGGLYASYTSYVNIVNSIIWDNIGDLGSEGTQIAVYTGFKYDKRVSTVNVSYSDVQGATDPNAFAAKTEALDLVFCIDTTGSMWDDIDAVKNAAMRITNSIATEIPNYRIAVVDYKDFNQLIDPNDTAAGRYGLPDDYPYQTVVEFTTDINAVVAGINLLTAPLGSGADWPESVYAALMHCIDHNSLAVTLAGNLYGASPSSTGPGPWRPGNVLRVVLLMGDAPPHEPEPFTNYTLGDIVTAAGGAEPKCILPILIGSDPTAAMYFTGLAEGTRGIVLQAADASEVVNALMKAIELISQLPEPIFVDTECVLNWDPNSYTWDLNSYNIDEDPLFVAGYYLSQIPAGQDMNSPCVDTGSDLASNLGLDGYTTRTDSIPDKGIVDMGYHYEEGFPWYELTVTVIEDPNDPGIHGYVDPNTTIIYGGIDDNVITLTAVPDAGYKVKKWTGTDNDTSTSRINTVTVTEDTHVTIEFEPAPLYNFVAVVIDRGDGPHGTIDPNIGSFFDGMTIPITATPDPNYEVRMWYGTDDDSSKEPNNTVTIRGADVFVAVEFGAVGQNIINLYDSFGVLDNRSPFLTIQAAIDAAEPNSTVVVSDGVYNGPGNYNLNLKAGLDPNDVRPITVRSENGPENCIIDCEGLGRAFIFDTNEPNDYIVDGFTITGGFAEFGGAILIDNSSPAITNCRIVYNTATGNGGAIYMTNSSPIITNTEISYNTAGRFGGGIYGEAESTAEIINCLITFNSSGDIGGAIYLYESDATITLCTIAYNTGLDYGDLDSYPNPKGGIAARDSDPTITNCIIGRSGGVYMWGMWGDQFSAGDDLYECEATFSLIENEDDDGDGVIHDDPLWVAGGLGSFYLSQFMGGQPQTSPAVNAGEQYILITLQATYNLGSITTSIVNASDIGIADMGYHYPFFPGPPIEYSLQIYVVGNGTVEPNQLPEVHYFAPGTVVNLKAIPDPGYRVSKWTGTDDDISVALLNSVNMSSNKTVFIEFESAAPRVLNVSTDGQYTYLGIQDAIDDAKEGDVVVLHSGTYAGTGFTVIGKNIIITGTNPDDPNVVASTIIDATNEINGGIHIIGAPGGTCVLNGITIMNSNPVGLNALSPQDPGDRGFDGEGHLPYVYMDTNLEGEYTGSGSVTSTSAITVFGNHIISNVIVRNCSLTGGNASGGNAGGEEGQDGGDGGWGGSVTGAGLYIGDIYNYYYKYITDPNDPNYFNYEPILISWGGSPVIENCIFDNCAAIAGNGANGGTGANYATGGTGGLSGRALGGGIFCGPGTSPTFINCTITNCRVAAANGGDGGDGGNPGAGGFGGLTYADPCQPDPELYSAYGAGVYCGIMSKPTFIDCTFSNNVTEGSVSGVGGFDNPSRRQEQPRRNYNIPSYGAGVYCDSGSSATFEGCTIEGNLTTYYGDEYTGYGAGVCFDGSEDYYYDSSFGYYPGYFFDSDSLGTVSATLTDCQITNNSSSVGGGVYGYATDLTVRDCNFADNLSYVGGGLCASDSLVVISGSTIQRNIASPEADPNTSLDPNDPNSFDEFKFGAGGGIYCATSRTVIRDCNITHNAATGSGGGLYLFGDSNTPQIINNLITNNVAGRDGGGISANWSANPLIANCTFVGNAASGTYSEPNTTGLGGGFYCSYDSNCVVTDSIFWNNFALKGDAIGIGTSFEFDSRPSILTISYSNVKAGQFAVWVDDDSTLNWGEGNIDDDPLFTIGPFGDNYLSQTDSGQSQNSPCVDAGSDYASYVGMVGYTTRTDQVADASIVDMGYHYLMAEPCKFCDLAYDGVINFHDFALLAERWLNEDCSETNLWCQGADITSDTYVDMRDVAFMADCWLVEDTSAPVPDPSRWETEPNLTLGTSIGMTAETAFDAWGWDVEYYFECVFGDCHDSGWQEGPTYTDRDLTSGTEYGYRVKARDKIGNETEWSPIRYAGGADTTPPAPAPYIESIGSALPNSISMVATTAYDDSDVEYFFESTSINGHDSGWQDDPNYTDVGLDPNTEYSYRVKARDKSPAQNETGWSETVTAVTPVPPDLIAPDPNPMEWDPTVDPNGFDGTPREIWIDLPPFDGRIDTFEFGATMTAVVAVDAGGGPVEYFFECITESDFSSVWIPDPTYTRALGRSGLDHIFRVKARDQFGNETASSPEDVAD